MVTSVSFLSEFDATVLMSCYNCEDTLSKSLASICQTTKYSIEYLLIDDASSDTTPFILAEFKRKNPNCTIITNTSNQGLGYSLMVGVLLAKGRYIIRSDADDISLPGRFDAQLDFLYSHPDCDILGTAIYKKRITNDHPAVTLLSNPKDHSEITKRIYRCPVFHPTVVFNRVSILKAGNYNRRYRRRQDYELWFRCILFGLKFSNLLDPFVVYSYNPKQEKNTDLRLRLHQTYIALKWGFLLRIPPHRIAKSLLPLLKSFIPRSLLPLISRLQDKILDARSKSF